MRQICKTAFGNGGMKRKTSGPEGDFTPPGVVRITKRQGPGVARVKP